MHEGASSSQKPGRVLAAVKSLVQLQAGGSAEVDPHVPPGRCGQGCRGERGQACLNLVCRLHSQRELDQTQAWLGG